MCGTSVEKAKKMCREKGKLVKQAEIERNYNNNTVNEKEKRIPNTVA